MGWSTSDPLGKRICVGLICGVIAIVLGARETKATKSGISKAGLICGIIGLVIVAMTVGFLLLVAFSYTVHLV